ncbi:hypothetical protein LV83_01406 [Algoriphagus yeomjeoni]|uniref:Uncharacterized protein n=1 Tax=Algoriphagus yeomjeoni TaxID=291403 RepID=A0A327PKT0_9BACT|nr:hypothetical protein LV83_01406 [Algoriphagus yeomjeoni]
MGANKFGVRLLLESIKKSDSNSVTYNSRTSILLGLYLGNSK